MFKKGESGNPTGRIPGKENETTRNFKYAVNNLLEKSSDRMLEWLERVAQDDPKGALSVLTSLAEYTYPKLARQEIQHEGKKDAPIAINIIESK